MKTTETIVSANDGAIAIATDGAEITVEVREYAENDDSAVSYTLKRATLNQLEADQLINALIDACDRMEAGR